MHMISFMSRIFMEKNMNFKSLLVILSLGFLTACAVPADTAGGDAAAAAAGELVAVELRNGKAVGVDGNGNVVDATLTELLRVMPEKVLFNFDRFDFANGDDRTTIDIYAALLKQNPDVTMVVEGHADERGTREYNLALGERRANTVYNRIISQNVASERLRKVSYGKERPEVLGSAEDSWRENRRAAILLFNY